MSDQTEQLYEVECGTCGRTGNPPPECELCHGNAPVQKRAYTRSEEIRGLGKDEARYGRTGNVSPKIVSLPGSMPPREG